MGSRMSMRLLQAGHALSIWNRSAAACAPLATQGALVLADLSQPITAEVIGLCLADDQAVQQVAARLIPQLQAGQIVVDFSSITAKPPVIWLHKHKHAAHIGSMPLYRVV